jgi:hypothetical protein
MLAIKQAFWTLQKLNKDLFLRPRKSVGLHTPYDPKFNSLFFIYQKTEFQKSYLLLSSMSFFAPSPPRRHPSCFLPSFLGGCFASFFFVVSPLIRWKPQFALIAVAQ